MFQLIPNTETQPVSADISNDANAYRYRRFIFTHPPSEIQYSGLGSDWATLERSGGFPFVDWKGFKLLNVSFSFVIAEPLDGILRDVEDRIQELRSMAQAPYPVRLYNMDMMLTKELRYDVLENARLVQFAIGDLQITGQIRNASQKITRALASITLQELPPDKTPLIQMPILKHKESPKIPPPPPPGTSEEVLQSTGLPPTRDFTYPG
jgi:hypothetical protein